MILIDQYNGRSVIDYSHIRFGSRKNYNSDAANYRILLVPGKK
jgi:hypothetical protein